MFDIGGKILQRIICDKMENAIAASGKLTEQYDFRKSHSTVDFVITTARKARGIRRTRKDCAIVILDVKNASARWDKILATLELV
ncbi:reverse [Lasius niger]|uniref:Reverse n=1 Tax=Lasius niger TaxID=67767 RepID=A0A0J7KLA6_LASNI|nr:reverse [Lasius niger]